MELVLFSRARNYKLIVGFGGIWFRRSASSIPSHIYAHAHDKLEKKEIKQRNELAARVRKEPAGLDWIERERKKKEEERACPREASFLTYHGFLTITSSSRIISRDTPSDRK
jgi:hypothetical protein